MDKIKAHYKDYLKIVLVAYTEVVGFYNSLGFKIAEAFGLPIDQVFTHKEDAHHD